ncbi:hypothetical protein Terro_1193 [Terriglobus roseus DSM 18391]|uniref:Cytochrome c domain-containing protein n=1 Tax=Terriglobus roseus (strain DSM 18391 / NRRL B-41598 / KBS 63) TaxID=926566 RepID=I3ZE35_TERRK|nr:hypothetical protein Terro_1193 [Terriglobus roseus DSM 18391]
MTRIRAHVMCLLMLPLGAVAQSPAAPLQARPAAVKTSTRQRISEGQRVFEQNCSRCHAAPDGFSPRIAGTVARHMRVRASLSEQDHEALRKFLHP